jgi:hypothetical protein
MVAPAHRGPRLCHGVVAPVVDNVRAIDPVLVSPFGSPLGYQIAEAYAWRGDKDRAFEWLEKAHAQHDGGLAFVKVDPILRSPGGDPRHTALLHKLNLAE